MLTRPSVFATAADQDQGPNLLIFRFVISGAAKMYSHAPINFGDGSTCYFTENRVIEIEGFTISEAVRLHDCSFDISAFTLVLNNHKDKGTGLSPSDDWSGFWQSITAGFVEVYLLAGKNAASLSDCLKIFKGTVASVPEFDPNTMRIQVENFSRKVHQDLPVTRANALGGTYKIENINRRLPLVFGEHISASGDPYSAADGQYGGRAGRIRAIRTTTKRFYLHAGDSKATVFWIKKKNGLLIQLTAAPTINVDGSGFSYVDVGDGIAALTGYLYAQPKAIGADTYHNLGTSRRTDEHYPAGYTNTDKDASYFQLGVNNVTDPALAYDKDGTTVAVLNSGIHYWNTGLDSTDKGTLVLGSFPKITNSDGASYSADEAFLFWKATLKTLSGYTIKYGTASGSPPYQGTEVTVYNNTLRNYSANIFDGSQRYLDITSICPTCDLSAVVAYFSVCAFKVAGSDPGNAGPLLDVAECFVRVRVSFPFEPEDELWYAGPTAKVDSIIDARTALSSTDVNKYPPYIIEQILHAMGESNGNIDTAAFDAVYDATQTAAVAVLADEKKPSLELFREISENSTGMYFMDALGLHTMVNRKPTAPGSADVTISYGHCVAACVVTETGLDYVVNDIGLDYDYDFENKKFRGASGINDITSQNRYGKRTKNKLSLRFIDKAVIENTSSTFMLALAWIFQYTRAVVRVELLGYRFAHVKIGDWIALDASFDPHVTFRGATWAGNKFYVTGRQIKVNTVTLEGMLVT